MGTDKAVWAAAKAFFAIPGFVLVGDFSRACQKLWGSLGQWRKSC
jgi:hypothetical protein